MNELEKKKSASGKDKRWRRPTIIFLGKVGDLVKGGGKSGPASDNDPQTTSKGGVG